ncbi:MAG: acetylserotonin O-methyltransferase [Acetobacteraceae bacterium]|nr:acetylserotonin O-methyltransferase [Acetobacteraceae bacterium]MDW8398337.1 methyltransferase [Acetobacteraceae bacterium]
MAALADRAPSGLREAVLSLRDRLVANPAFRRWAARFPLTRRIARKRARALFDLSAGFVYSQILYACVRLDLFAVLAEGPAEERTLAARLSLPPEGASLLLKGAEALGLVQRRGALWGLGPLGAAMVGNRAVAAMVEHHAALYADLADPVALLRGQGGGGELARLWGYVRAEDPRALGAQDVARYSALMADSQTLIADEVLDAFDLSDRRLLMDVGGGEGAFLIAAGRRHPALRLRLFDLPAVAERARARFAAAGMAARAEAVGGDFHRDALPGGADAVSLLRVVHDHDDAAAARLLARAHAALPPGGVLLLAEPMAGTPGAEPVGDAYFGFYLRAMGSGRPRRAAELVAMLRAAGFAEARPVPTATPLQTGLIVARRGA